MNGEVTRHGVGLEVGEGGEGEVGRGPRECEIGRFGERCVVVEAEPGHAGERKVDYYPDATNVLVKRYGEGDGWDSHGA